MGSFVYPWVTLFLKTFSLVIEKASEIGCLLNIGKNCLRKLNIIECVFRNLETSPVIRFSFWLQSQEYCMAKGAGPKPGGFIV